MVIIVLGTIAGFFVWRIHSGKPSDHALVKLLQSNSFGLKKQLASQSDRDYVAAEMALCYSTNDNNCYKQVAQLFYWQFGTTRILNVFKDTESQKEVFARCHEAAHYIGRMTYDDRGSVAYSYEKGNDACWGGFYHGVIEQYFKSKNIDPFQADHATLVNHIHAVCGNQEDFSAPRIYAECLHGIGHAMMFITDADVPKSLEFCDALPTQENREICYSGVFMENSSSSTNLDHPTKYLKADDPMYPCTILDMRYARVCYEYQSSYFAELSQWDWAKTGALCAKVPSDFQQGCYSVMGSNQVGYTQDLQQMIDHCQLAGSEEHQNQCINGVVNALGARYVGDANRMLEFCNIVPKNFKDFCFTGMGTASGGWSKDAHTQTEACAIINDKQYADACRSARSKPQ